MLFFVMSLDCMDLYALRSKIIDLQRPQQILLLHDFFGRKSIVLIQFSLFHLNSFDKQLRKMQLHVCHISCKYHQED